MAPTPARNRKTMIASQPSVEGWVRGRRGRAGVRSADMEVERAPSMNGHDAGFGRRTRPGDGMVAVLTRGWGPRSSRYGRVATCRCVARAVDARRFICSGDATGSVRRVDPEDHGAEASHRRVAL